MPKGIPLSTQDQSQRRQEIFSVALRLLRTRGFGEVSLRELAEAAGVGKSTLYDYFSSRDELLLWGLEEAVNGLIAEANRLAAAESPAPEKLRQLLRLYQVFLTSDNGLNTQLLAEVLRLAPASRARVQDRLQPLAALLTQTIAAGIRSGSMRRVNAALAARGLLAWIDSSPADLEDILDMAFNGLLESRSDRRSLWKGH